MRRLFFLAAGMFVMGCDDYVFAGLLPSISGSLGTSLAGTAQGIAAFGITYVASAPVCAVLLARRPARLVLIAALLTFAAGTGLTLVAGSLTAYIVSRAIAGLGAGLFLPVAVAAATQLVEPGARGRALSLIWGSNSAGAVLGVPAALWLAEHAGWRASIALILVLGVLALAGVALGQPAVRVSAPPSLGDQARLLSDRRVLAVIGVTLVTAMGSLGLYAYISSFVTGEAISALSLWSIGGLIGSFAIGSVVDRTGQPRRVMAMILASLVLATAVLPALRSVSVLGLLPFLIWGAMGWATMTPQQYSLISLQPDHDATLVALNGSAVSLGSVAGAALGGLALTHGLDARNLPYAASLLLLCALAWQLTLLRQPRQAVPA